MTVANTQYYPGIDFDTYLKMPGISFSGLKGEIPVSSGMRLGSLVHTYLNEPAKYQFEQADIVIPIATALRARLGSAFKYLQKEVAFISEFTHNDLKLLYKGRADCLSIGKIVVDFKILAGALDPAIERFGYRDQISGYCLATGCKVGLIIAYNKAQKKVEVKSIKPCETFWGYTTARMGEPVC